MLLCLFPYNQPSPWFVCFCFHAIKFLQDEMPNIWMCLVCEDLKPLFRWYMWAGTVLHPVSAPRPPCLFLTSKLNLFSVIWNLKNKQKQKIRCSVWTVNLGENSECLVILSVWYYSHKACQEKLKPPGRDVLLSLLLRCKWHVALYITLRCTPWWLDTQVLPCNYHSKFS